MTPSQHSNAVENQTTFCLWFHHCYVGCTSPWHDQSSPQTTFLLSSFEDDLNVDTSNLNDKDVKIWRLDLLNNSDGDESKWSTNAEDVVASQERMEGYLNPVEKECEKLFDHTTERIFFNPNSSSSSSPPEKASGTHIFSNPTDIMKSLPAGYILMHRSRSNTANRAGDLHVWGHPSGIYFNSAAKFVKHLKWLIEGRVGACDCPPCKGER